MKNIFGFIRKPLFVVITLLIGIICFLTSAIIPEYSYVQENEEILDVTFGPDKLQNVWNSYC